MSYYTVLLYTHNLQDVKSLFVIRLTWYAFDRGIADIADRAFADWIVIVNMAQRVPAARIANNARIYAERIYALLIARAFAICVTFRSKSWKRRSDRNCNRNFMSILVMVRRER